MPEKQGFGNWRSVMSEWRRGGDSNPRYACTYAAFRVRCIRPLCHLSGRCPVGRDHPVRRCRAGWGRRASGRCGFKSTEALVGALRARRSLIKAGAACTRAPRHDFHRGAAFGAREEPRGPSLRLRAKERRLSSCCGAMAGRARPAHGTIALPGLQGRCAFLACQEHPSASAAGRHVGHSAGMACHG